MTNAITLLFAAALLLWKATAFLSRDRCFRSDDKYRAQSLHPGAHGSSPLAAGNSASQSFSDGPKQTRWQSHKCRRSDTRERSKFESLLRGKTASEINEWMQAQGRNDTTTEIPLDQWSSHEETDFIRTLRDHKAYRAIDLFTKHLARKNVFIYTAAIASLATADEYKAAALQLLDEMERNQVRPSPYTFSALFQATDSPKKAQSLQARLKREYPSIPWTAPLWETAIYACGQKPGSWTIAQHFLSEMQEQGLSPTARTYMALFQVCSSTANVSQAIAMLRDLLLPGSPVTVTPRIWGAALQVCAVIGDHASARTILSLMQENSHPANVRHCTAYLKALAASRQDRAALDFLDFMVASQHGDNANSTPSPWHGLSVEPPDRIALQAVLTACAATENYIKSRWLLERIKNGDYGDVQVDEKCYNLVLASCRDPADAKVLVREMRLTRRHREGVVPPSQITYTRAITVCRKAADMPSALSFLNRSRDDAIVPDVYMYSAAIWTAARAGDCEAAFRLLQEMKDCHCTPNIITYNGIITALQTCGRADDTVAIFQEVKEKGLSPTLTTYQQLACVVRKVNGYDNKIELLERIFQGVDPRRVEVEGPGIELLISAYGALGRYDEAKGVFDSIQGQPDIPCLRAMLFACSRASPPNWQDATTLLEANTKKHKKIDHGALCSTMLACSKSNEWGKSLELLRLYGTNETSVIAFNSLIAACGRGRRPDMAIEILNEMGDSYGVQPDELSYRNAIIACNQAEHEKRQQQRTQKVKASQATTISFEWWEAALSLLRRMQEDGLQPDTQTFSSAISACEAAGQWQRSLGILQCMLDSEKGDPADESVLNQYCFNAAISSCEKGNAWVEALEIYERMKERGGSLKPTIVTLSSLILALDKMGQKEIAQSYYKEGLQNKILNPWRFTRNGDKNVVRALDLHKFSAAMARAAIRCHFDDLLDTSPPVATTSTVPRDSLVIIVGKGLHSESDEPVLLPTVQRLLEREYGIQATVQANNTGRLVVDGEVLSTLVATKSWR